MRSDASYTVTSTPPRLSVQPAMRPAAPAPITETRVATASDRLALLDICFLRTQTPSNLHTQCNRAFNYERSPRVVSSRAGVVQFWRGPTQGVRDDDAVPFLPRQGQNRANDFYKPLARRTCRPNKNSGA